LRRAVGPPIGSAFGSAGGDGGKGGAEEGEGGQAIEEMLDHEFVALGAHEAIGRIPELDLGSIAREALGEAAF
jgi:hypothetical protein